MNNLRREAVEGEQAFFPLSSELAFPNAEDTGILRCNQVKICYTNMCFDLEEILYDLTTFSSSPATT